MASSRLTRFVSAVLTTLMMFTLSVVGLDSGLALAADVSTQRGATTSWMSASDNLQHIAYIGQDGHVYELYMHPGQRPWHYDDPAAIAGTPLARSGAVELTT